MKKKNKFQKGFTLLETVVALGILAICIGGIFVSLQDIEMNFGYAKGYITAAYLNQEAIEFIRNIKDSNIYEPNPSDEKYYNDIIDPVPDPIYYEVGMTIQGGQYSPISSFLELENKCFSQSGFNAKDCYDLSVLKEMNIKSDAPYYFYGGAGDQKTGIKRAVKVSNIFANDGSNDYESIKLESIVLFKVKEKVYVHKVTHFMYDK